MQYFIEYGAVSADCSFTDFPNKGSVELANVAFVKKLKGDMLNSQEENAYKFQIIFRLARMFEKNNIAMLIHTGVIRNQNTNRFKALGADCGIDSVGNTPNIENAGRLFDYIESRHGMPKTVAYTLNHNAYYPLATMLGNFSTATRGKLQLGAAWWFCDHRDGIKDQLKVFASTNGLGIFNGMLTDSRSFVSYARHDYFRRILCSLIGEWVDNGEYPDDKKAIMRLLHDICYNNAKKFFAK